MSTDTTLAVAGVALTIFFGIWGLALARRTKYPGRIAVFYEYCAALFGTRARETPGLEISFRGDELTNPLVMLKLILLNDGHVDIRKDMIDRGLTFQLPAGYSWKEVTVTEASPEVLVRPTLIGPTLTINMNLLRKGEAFSFEALVEVPHSSTDKTSPARKLRSSIQISHRISETAQPQIRPIQSQRDEKAKMAELIAQLVIPAVAALVIFVFIPPSRLTIGLVSHDHAGKVTTAQISAKDADTQTVEVEFDDGAERESTLEEFNKAGNWQLAVIRKPHKGLLIPIVTMTILAIPPLLSLVAIRRIRRTRKALDSAGFSTARLSVTPQDPA